jgi:hypothetical protein
MQHFLAQTANRKAQASFPADSYRFQPAVPFMQTPPDSYPGAFYLSFLKVLD